VSSLIRRSICCSWMRAVKCGALRLRCGGRAADTALITNKASRRSRAHETTKASELIQKHALGLGVS
jgi:hypothetical protein